MNKNIMNSTKHKKIVTRFAPSPTGFMHVGGVRTALYAYLWARKNNGTFILRIEDTDKEREVEGSIDHIIESLNWLKINYDEGPGIDGPNAPYIQSERLEKYKKYAQILIDKGFAYPDPYTKDELENFRKESELAKKPFLYREHRPEQFEVWDGTKPLRFKTPTIKRYEWADAVYGKLSAGEEALDDFILIKSDGYPTYNFAHIVDDIEMQVTHVMRSQEFISSTPKFISLYEALGIMPPIFVTLPPIMALDGKKKLGKRDGAKDVLEYKNEGILPEAMFNFLAFLGWNPGDEREIMSINEIIDAFDIDRIGHSGAQFNEEKLLWVNREYIKKMPYEEQEEYILNFIPQNIKDLPHFTTEIMHKITPIIVERISSGIDVEAMAVAGELDYYFKFPKLSTDVLISQAKKYTLNANLDEISVTRLNIEKIMDLLSNIDENNWNKETVKEALWDYATSAGRASVLWPMRYALSGAEKSPDPFILAEVFEKEGTETRLTQALEILNENKQ